VLLLLAWGMKASFPLVSDWVYAGQPTMW